ncbi:MAG: hypothetical protein ACC654_10335 [Acidimicrobiia bacterium]
MTNTEFEPPNDSSETVQRSAKRRSVWLLAATVVAVVLIVALFAVVSGDPAPAVTVEQLALGAQGGDGVWSNDAVTLERREDRLVVTLSAPRPDPGTYNYPPPETPAGDPTPMPGPGETEVFTLWMFLFNHPPDCKDPNVCRMVDILPDAETGEPPAAEGAIYQLDGIIADGDWLEMSGEITVGSPSAAGAILDDPYCAHVHIGMAPHGRALSGADLEEQLSNAIGNPDFWWAAQFESIDPAFDC